MTDYSGTIYFFKTIFPKGKDIHIKIPQTALCEKEITPPKCPQGCSFQRTPEKTTSEKNLKTHNKDTLYDEHASKPGFMSLIWVKAELLRGNKSKLEINSGGDIFRLHDSIIAFES